MKTSLILTFSILSLAALLGWKNHRVLTAANQSLREVSREASVLGVPTESSGKPTVQRPHREERTVEDVKTLAAGLLDFARELETVPEPADGAAADERQLRMLDWQRRLAALDPEKMKELLAEINAATGIKDETRQELLQLALQTLAETHPQETLDLIASTPHVLTNPYGRAKAVSTALLRLMESEPTAATTWFKEHRGMFEGKTGDWLTERILRGTGLINPKTAFALIGELDLPNVEYAVGMIINPARNRAERDASLAAFREFIQTLPEAEREPIVSEANSSLMMNAFFEGMDSGLKWIEGAGFSQKELEDYASRTFRSESSEARGKWLDWLIKNVPTETTNTMVVHQLFGDWMQYDYQAAGQWLEKAPAGQAKESATAAYASMIAPYQPETAERWAITLPAGENRDHTLQTIRLSLLASDPAGAAAFAAKHGIKDN